MDIWTLYGGDADHNDGLEDEAHALLILGRQEGTMILQTGQEIMELDQSGFATEGPTVFASNIGGDKFIVQVKWGGNGRRGKPGRIMGWEGREEGEGEGWNKGGEGKVKGSQKFQPKNW